MWQQWVRGFHELDDILGPQGEQCYIERINQYVDSICLCRSLVHVHYRHVIYWVRFWDGAK